MSVVVECRRGGIRSRSLPVHGRRLAPAPSLRQDRKILEHLVQRRVAPGRIQAAHAGDHIGRVFGRVHEVLTAGSADFVHRLCRRSNAGSGVKACQIYRLILVRGGTFGANSLGQTIGLGRADGIERLEVLWPTAGQTQAFRLGAP